MILQQKGIPVYYTDEGHGDVVILLHGFLENTTMWKDLIPQLSIKNRIIAIDLLGHGQTGCLGYIHTMEMMAESVNAVLKHLEIKDAIFIGHSMGGYVALAFAELFPEKINALCLMNSSASSDSLERQLNRERAIIAVKLNHITFISMSISNLFAPENRESFTNEISQVKKEALKMSLQGIIAALEGMKIRKDRTEFLRNSKVRKLIIVGLKDPVLNYNDLIVQTLESGIEIVEFPDGHMSHIENRKELSYKLSRFIEK